MNLLNGYLIKKQLLILKKGDDNDCFMYAITVALNHKKIGRQRKDWETFERGNDDITLNILSLLLGKKTTELQYKSKYNPTRRNQVLLLMITNNINWHYLALKSISMNYGFMKPTQSISRLFSQITSTNTTSDYYCLNCFHSYRTESMLKEHKLVCENHDYCILIMPKGRGCNLKYAHGKNH